MSEGRVSALPFLEESAMMKIYIYNGFERWYEEGKQPEGAVEVKKAEPADKAKKPANKAKKGATK